MGGSVTKRITQSQLNITGTKMEVDKLIEEVEQICSVEFGQTSSGRWYVKSVKSYDTNTDEAAAKAIKTIKVLKETLIDLNKGIEV